MIGPILLLMEIPDRWQRNYIVFVQFTVVFSKLSKMSKLVSKFSIRMKASSWQNQFESSTVVREKLMPEKHGIFTYAKQPSMLICNY